MPDISSEGDYELPRNDQAKARGLRLREKYLDAKPTNVVPMRTAAKADAPALASPQANAKVLPDASARPPRQFARDTVAMPPPPPPETKDGADEDARAPSAKGRADSETPEAEDVHRRPTRAMQRLKRKVSNG